MNYRILQLAIITMLLLNSFRLFDASSCDSPIQARSQENLRGCDEDEFMIDGKCRSCYEITRHVSQSIIHAVDRAKLGCTKDSDCDFHPAQSKFFGRCQESIMKSKHRYMDEEIEHWDSQYTDEHRAICGYMTPMCIIGSPYCNLKTRRCEETPPDPPAGSEPRYYSARIRLINPRR